MSFYHPSLSDDPVLDAIDREERKPVATELAALLGSGYVWSVAGETAALPMPPPGAFGMLTAIESPLLDPRGKPDDDDLRVAGFLFFRAREAKFIGGADVKAAALNFWGGSTPDRADLYEVIRDAFGPYRRLPPGSRRGGCRGDDGEPLLIDSMFLAGLVTRVHRVTGLTPDAILWELPMAAAALYDLEFRRYELHTVFSNALPPPTTLVKRKIERIYELIKR